MLNYQQIYLFGNFRTSQTVGLLYSDTSPYKVSEYSLPYNTPDNPIPK